MRIYAEDMQRAINSLPTKPLSSFAVTPLIVREQVVFGAVPQESCTVRNLTWQFDGAGWFFSSHDLN